MHVITYRSTRVQMKTKFDKVFIISEVDVMQMRMPSPHEYSFFRFYFLSVERISSYDICFACIRAV